MAIGSAPMESVQVSVTRKNENEKPPRVSVLIINYNGLEFLDELLSSLRKQTFRDFETVLIDNASQDASLDFVRRHYPEVIRLPQSENLGFSRAGNLGASFSRAPYLVFLNTDMRVEDDWLAQLVAPAEEDSRVAAVASKMKLYHQPERLNGVGGSMNYLGYTWDRGMFEKDQGQYDETSEVLFASAGAALFRRETFLQVGGFDEAFFMYHEDVDLGWRLWLLGHRILTAPRAVVYHHFGGSTRQNQGLSWREKIGERNNIRTLLKNYQMKRLLRVLVDLLLLRQPPRRKLAQLGNFLWNAGRLPGTLRHRFWIQRRRVRTDQDLEELIVQSKDVPIRL